jgi:hypothetical protein
MFYLMFCFLYFLVWLPMYLYRKDLHREMITLSLLFGIAGVASELTYVGDWWQPATVTGTRIGIEDLLIGFFIGGIIAVAYEELFRKRIGRSTLMHSKWTELGHWMFLVAFAAVFFTAYYVFDISSFYASLLAFWLFTTYMLFQRSDLLIDALMSALIAVVIGTTVYMTLNIFYPNFIQHYWYLPDVWFSRLFLGIPLAEYIWYFSAGAFIGPLYEFVEHAKLRNLSRVTVRRKRVR